MELLGLPLTGARAFTLGLCFRKDVVNGHLRALGLPVPGWAVARAGAPLAWRRYPAIVKPAAEDASVGIDARSVVRNRRELLAALARGHKNGIPARAAVRRRPRVQPGAGRDRVLPHSEITFALPRGLPRIVSYAAKWEPAASTTRARRPSPGRGEAGLGARLTRMAQRVWAAVDGVGYGRVDVRMDRRGRSTSSTSTPTPTVARRGAGRQAAAAGWSYDELVGRIVDLAFSPRPAGPRPRSVPRGRPA